MSSNRSKKMLELVQVRNPAPQPATQDKEHESVPSAEVTMLADIRNKPENQGYLNVQEYFEILESASVSNENHSNKMMELVQVRNPVPKPATQDKEYESVPSTEVMMLADITNKPVKQGYLNVQEYFEISKSASVSNENHLHNTTICTDERHLKSKNSDVDLSDQDPTYKIPSKKQRLLVYPSRSKSSGSFSSSTSSSSSSSSGSSSDSSDTDSSDKRYKTQDSIVQVTAEKQSEQTIVNEPTTTEDSLNQDIIENTTLQEEKKKGRKRKRNEESWKQNKAKSLRNAGKPYISKKNKAVKPRSVQPPCGDKCRLKCCGKITADQRQTIFNVYWNLGQVDAQRSFIMSCMTNITPRYKSGPIYSPTPICSYN